MATLGFQKILRERNKKFRMYLIALGNICCKIWLKSIERFESYIGWKFLFQYLAYLQNWKACRLRIRRSIKLKFGTKVNQYEFLITRNYLWKIFKRSDFMLFSRTTFKLYCLLNFNFLIILNIHEASAMRELKSRTYFSREQDL